MPYGVLVAHLQHGYNFTIQKKKEPESYRLAFLLNTIIGGLMLLLSAIAYVLEMKFPSERGTLVWGFLFPAVLLLFLASLDYARYLNSMNDPQRKATGSVSD